MTLILKLGVSTGLSLDATAVFEAVHCVSFVKSLLQVELDNNLKITGIAYYMAGSPIRSPGTNLKSYLVPAD